MRVANEALHSINVHFEQYLAVFRFENGGLLP